MLLFMLKAFSFILLCKIYFKLTVRKCKTRRKLDGKTVLITGASRGRGIGYETALDAAKRGARVVITSRKLEDSYKTRDQLIIESGNNNIIAKQLNFLSLDSVRAFAKDFVATEPRLDVLVNNAAATGHRRTFTKDGLIKGLQVNYFGPFLLTHLLLGLLKKSKPSRIVNIGSFLANFAFFTDINDINYITNIYLPNILLEYRIYSTSKLLIAHATIEMANRLKNTGVTVNCLHPGLINTDIYHDAKLFYFSLLVRLMEYISFKTPLEGIQSTIHLAVCESTENVTGCYYNNCKKSRLWAKLDEKTRKIVWKQSIKLVGLQPHEICI